MVVVPNQNISMLNRDNQNEAGEKVSILMCAFNAQEYIEDAILSLINQTHRNIEIVIVNDGSVDQTQNIIDKYQKIDQRIKSIYKRNEGLTAALISGLDNCVGKWIARQDADDISLPYRIENQLRFCLLKNIDFCTAKARIMQTGKIIPTVRSNLAFDKELLSYGNPHVHGTFFFRSSLLKMVKYDPLFKKSQDFDFLLKVVVSKIKCGMLDQVLYGLNKHDDAISTRHRDEQLACALAALRKNGLPTDEYIASLSTTKQVMPRIKRFMRYHVI
jgi:glycosyltransferase involved in cell wall biosynthesis